MLRCVKNIFCDAANFLFCQTGAIEKLMSRANYPPEWQPLAASQLASGTPCDRRGIPAETMPLIKKYDNRRLYDTGASRYVNLADIAALIRAGEDVRIEDARNVDITRDVLLQVILESPGGPELLPIGLLRRIIRVTGDDPVQRWLRPGLLTATEMLHDQLDQAEARLLSAWRGAAPPVDKSAAPPSVKPARPADAASQHKAAKKGAASQTSTTPAPPLVEDPPPGEDPELDELRARLSKLESRLKRK